MPGAVLTYWDSQAYQPCPFFGFAFVRFISRRSGRTPSLTFGSYVLRIFRYLLRTLAYQHWWEVLFIFFSVQQRVFDSTRRFHVPRLTNGEKGHVFYSRARGIRDLSVFNSGLLSGCLDVRGTAICCCSARCVTFLVCAQADSIWLSIFIFSNFSATVVLYMYVCICLLVCISSSSTILLVWVS